MSESSDAEGDKDVVREAHISPSEFNACAEYAYYRREIGNRREVSDLLGISIRQMIRRENGDCPPGREAIFAMRYAAWIVGCEVDHRVIKRENEK